MRRKHRRKYAKNASCRCPAGSVKVTTCRKVNGQTVCRGRGWSCLGRGRTAKGKMTSRFVAMICDGGSQSTALARRSSSKLTSRGRKGALLLGP